MGLLFFDRISNVELDRIGPQCETSVLRIPNGVLRAEQLHCVAGLTENHARGPVDLTVRQSIHLHGPAIQSLPKILQELHQKGLTASDRGKDKESIRGCPLAGIDAGEICDPSPLINRAREMLIGDATFYTLPYKLRISISGCRVCCFHPESAEIALTATRRKRNGIREVGFMLRIGGELSSAPHGGLRVPAFIRYEQVLPVLKSVTDVCRNSECLRRESEGARLRYPLHQSGWTAQSFLRALEKQLGFRLDASEIEPAALVDACRDHLGIYPQKQPGRFYAGIVLQGGHISAAQSAAAADLAERYGSGDLLITNMQNLVILNVSKSNVDPLAAELEKAELPLQEGETACNSAIGQGDGELRSMLPRSATALVAQEAFCRAVAVSL
jgi:sulfite reductase (ferredoxin)